MKFARSVGVQPGGTVGAVVLLGNGRVVNHFHACLQQPLFFDSRTAGIFNTVGQGENEGWVQSINSAKKPISDAKNGLSAHARR